MKKAHTFLKILIVAAAVAAIMIPIGVSAATTTDFRDQGDPNVNRRMLNNLIGNNSPKVINIKSDIEINTFLRPGNNTTINAGSHRITITESDKGAITNVPRATGYSAIRNLTINGGIWSVRNNAAIKQSIVRLAHGNNIRFNNVTINDGFADHAVELIACKNVYFYGCNFTALGSCPAKCLEEQLQIDVADKFTAPGIVREAGKKYANGAPCVNITVDRCTISGARGVCANYASRNAANRKAKSFHSKINIKNSSITGISSEAVALFNTKSGSVTGCRIVTYAPVKRNSYSVGLHVAYQSKSKPPKASTKNVITIKNNNVWGGRQAIFVYSHVKTKFGKVVVQSNNGYCKKGKKGAIRADKKVAKKVVMPKKSNKTYKW